YDPTSLVTDQHPPGHALGLEGTLIFQPEGSDWRFSIGARYGRSHRKGHVHHQTSGQLTRGGLYYTSGGGTIPITYIPPAIYRHAEAFSDVKAFSSEQHLILDFSVGRDVGIGLFGRDDSSSLSAGVRAVEFSQSTTTSIYARPEITFHNRLYPFPVYLGGPAINQYSLTGHSQRSFHGVGPSFAWNASAGLLGNTQDGELSVDWGINVAVLFGKQKAKTDHATAATHYTKGTVFRSGYSKAIYPSRHYQNARLRSVAVPNLGGFAGFSVKYPNVKVSLGYRADFFFGAIDAGIDARQTKDLGFHGPFATVSVGLGGWSEGNEARPAAERSAAFSVLD